ncbi:hypothetical protein GCM10009753_68070 [Streptantibioticus ferralitis]
MTGCRVLWLCQIAVAQREDALRDADGDALEGPVGVLFQVELALEGVVHRLDQSSLERWP